MGRIRFRIRFWDRVGLRVRLTARFSFLVRIRFRVRLSPGFQIPA